MITVCEKCGGLKADAGEAVAGKICEGHPFENANPIIGGPTLGNVTFGNPPVGKVPYRCPICGGTTLVPAGFYSSVTGVSGSTTTGPEKCRACINGVIFC